MKNIAIIGSGSWGVALSIYLANEGNKIKDIKLLGCYLLTKKDENTSSEYNQIYYIL